MSLIDNPYSDKMKSWERIIDKKRYLSLLCQALNKLRMCSTRDQDSDLSELIHPQPLTAPQTNMLTFFMFFAHHVSLH